MPKVNVIKTPTGLIAVDPPAKFVTQTEYNNLTDQEKQDGIYYITNNDGSSIIGSSIGGIKEDEKPAEDIKFTPSEGLTSNTIQDAVIENAKNINNMKPKTVNATASSTSWAGASAPYTNLITVSGVTASNIVEVGLASNANDDQVKACMKASIAKITQENGKIKLYAYGKKPEVDLPLVCVIVNV